MISTGDSDPCIKQGGLSRGKPAYISGSMARRPDNHDRFYLILYAKMTNPREHQESEDQPPEIEKQSDAECRTQLTLSQCPLATVFEKFWYES